MRGQQQRHPGLYKFLGEGSAGGGVNQKIPLDSLLNWGSQTLREHGIPAIEARWLLQWALQADNLLTAPTQVGLRIAERYRSAIRQRQHHIPLQHITGEMSFRSLTLKAGPGVFCCRPETELIPDLAEPFLRSPHTRIADLCAGSGAIGLALAVEFCGCQVVAVEKSHTAATYARANLEKYAPEFAPGSSLTVVEDDAIIGLGGADGTFDLVVCNPPYVRARPVQCEALHDPEEALYGGGEDGLVIPRGITTRSADLLCDRGVLIMELAEEQCELMGEFACQQGFAWVRVERDLTGRPRFIVAHKEDALVEPAPKSSPARKHACENEAMMRAPTDLRADLSTDLLPDLLTVSQAEVPARAAQIQELLAADRLIVVPTETVYGIGANPSSAPAVKRLLAAKGRNETMPPPVLAPTAAAALELADLDQLDEATRAVVHRAAAEFWPGALTLILPAKPGLGWDTVRQSNTVALRVPRENTCLQLLEAVGVLAVTSANLTGEPPATSVAQAQAYFGDEVACYVDAGTALIGESSTIVDATQIPWRIVRTGPISANQLQESLEIPVRDPEQILEPSSRCQSSEHQTSEQSAESSAESSTGLDAEPRSERAAQHELQSKG